MTGDPLFVFALGGTKPLLGLGVLHYVRNAIVALGPVVLFFFLWAGAAHAQPGPGKGGSGFPRIAALLVLLHVAVLSLLAWDALPFGRSVGFLRHLAVLAPAIALVATRGLEDWLAPGPRPRLVRGIFAAAWPVAAALWGSHRLIAHSFTGPEREEWRWIVSTVLGLLGLLFLMRSGLRRAREAAPPLVAVAAAVIALAVVRPIPLDGERKAIAEAVAYLERYGLQGAVVHTNHPWFCFLTGRDRYDLVRTPELTRERLAAAPPGSLVLWENHYGHRLYGDVPIEELREDAAFERLLELTAGSDETFRVVLFRKR